jgi:hypothetical protein
MYKAGETYYGVLLTHDYATGAIQNASVLPTAVAMKNGTDDVLFVLTVTNIDTGRYSVSGTIPTTYTDGTVVNVVANFTVNAIAMKAVLDSFVTTALDNTDLVIGGQTITIE